MNIFISYSSKNRTLIPPLERDLTEIGHNVWYDQNLSGGQAWWDEILHNIRDCDLFIFALTPESLASYPCKLEYGYAAALGKNILPVVLKTVNTTLLPPELSVLQFVDYQKRNRESLILLTRALGKLPAIRALPNALPTPPDVPISPLGKLNQRIQAPTLSNDEQAAILFDLKEHLENSATNHDARQLLLNFKAHPDLRSRVEDEIDELLGSPERHSAAPRVNASVSRKFSRRWLVALSGIVGIAAVIILLLNGPLTAITANPTPTNNETASPTNTHAVTAVPATPSPTVPTPVPLPTHSDELRTLTGHSLSIRSVAFSPDGKTVLTGSEDKTARLWDVATGKTLQTFTGHTSRIWSVAFAPDGKTVLTGSEDKTARLWDVATGKTLQTLIGHSLSVRSVAFAPDGKTVLTGSEDKTARLWDVTTGNSIHIFSEFYNWVNGITYAADGRTFLAASLNSGSHLFDISTGREIRLFGNGITNTWSIAFSPDGKTLLAGSSDTAVRLWDVKTGDRIKTFAGHTGSVFALAYAPNGKTFVTGSGDKTARLWDIETGETLQILTGHTGNINAIAFAPDGKTVLTGSEDGTARLWTIDLDKLPK